MAGGRIHLPPEGGRVLLQLTKFKKSEFSDSQIRGWDLFGKHLVVYSKQQGTPGPASPDYDHDISHINLENGSIQRFHSTTVAGPGREEDQYILVASTGPINGDPDEFAAVYFRNPDDNYGQSDTEWDLAWQSNNNDWEAVEMNVVIDGVLEGDATGKNLIGYINQDGNFNLFRFNKDSDSFEKVLELENTDDFSISGDQIAIVKDNEVWITTEDNPNDLTKVEGSEGAREVDINRDILLVTKDDGTYMIHKDLEESVKIYDESMTNPWLEGLEDLLNAMGSVHANTYDVEHFDITLNI